MPERSSKVLVIGVGSERGVGAAVAKRLAREGRHVIAVSRTPERLDAVVRAIAAEGGRAEAFRADVTQEADVAAVFDRAMTDDEAGGPVDIVIFNAGNNQPHDFRTLPAALFESMWRTGCYSGFLVGREAARRLAPLGRGTIIFTGASGSMRGRPTFAHFAAAKAGLRVVAQAMAREFGPQGLHVAHVVIDGGINGDMLNTRYPAFRERVGDDGLLNIDAIAETYWQIHRQHPSAWTHEIDLRPFKEVF